MTPPRLLCVAYAQILASVSEGGLRMNKAALFSTRRISMTNTDHGIPWVALAAAAALVLSACSSSAADTPGATGVAEEALLPTVQVDAYEVTPSLAEVIQLGDNAVRAKLVGIKDGYRIPIGPEDKENAEERLGLVFRVEESYLGDASVGDEIKIDGPGYLIDSTTKTRERKAKRSTNGVSVDTWTLGEDYMFFYVDTAVGLRFRSQRLIGQLTKDGSVTPISDLGTIPEFADATTIANLVKQIDKAANLTPVG